VFCTSVETQVGSSTSSQGGKSTVVKRKRVPSLDLPALSAMSASKMAPLTALNEVRVMAMVKSLKLQQS
jgi:hypothetical protein